MFNLCYVCNDDSKQAFPVKIIEDENVRVGTLEECIQDKGGHTFHDINTKSIVLWKASVPFNRKLKEKVKALNLVDDDSWQPFKILVDVFPCALY
jgi:hypothetical protein